MVNSLAAPLQICNYFKLWEPRAPTSGEHMQGARPEPLRQLVRELVEVLEPYEEELIVAEQVCPDVVYLRRALGMTIAEAFYWISDKGSGPAPANNDET